MLAVASPDRDLLSLARLRVATNLKGIALNRLNFNIDQGFKKSNPPRRFPGGLPNKKRSLITAIARGLFRVHLLFEIQAGISFNSTRLVQLAQ